LDQSIEILVPERMRRRHRFHRADYMSGPVSRPMETDLQLYGLRRDGTEFPAEISLSPIQTHIRLVDSQRHSRRNRALPRQATNPYSARFRPRRHGRRRRGRPHRAGEHADGKALRLRTKGTAGSRWKFSSQSVFGPAITTIARNTRPIRR
jgi:hypothetical protein